MTAMKSSVSVWTVTMLRSWLRVIPSAFSSASSRRRRRAAASTVAMSERSMPAANAMASATGCDPIWLALTICAPSTRGSW